VADVSEQFDFYVSFDIETHTIDALQLILEKLRQALERPTAWKWAVVGLHSAMHGGFALVLRRTDGAQLRPKKFEQKLHESWERERTTGQLEGLHYDHVDWFTELYKKTQDPQRMSYLGGKPLVPTKEQNESIEQLNDFRGELIHFSDTTRSIEIMIFIDLLNDLIPVLRFFFFEAQHVAFVHWEQAERARELLDAIQEETSRIQRFLEEESQKSSKTRIDEALRSGLDSQN
jgi:hypothetical protein